MGSKPNKLHIILKMFGFLVFSIGILYICQFFNKSIEEGFLNTPPRCVKIEGERGRTLMLCSTLRDGKDVLAKMSEYLPGSNDNLCIESEETPKYFTCYTKPTQPVYNDVYGIYRPYDYLLDKDTMPQDLAPSIDSFCASYNINTVKIIRAISTAEAAYTGVQKTDTNFRKYINDVTTLKTLYCNPNSPNPNITPTQCTNITTAFTTLNSILNTSDLQTDKATLLQTIEVLKNMSTQIYSVYDGSKCNTTPGYVLGRV